MNTSHQSDVFQFDESAPIVVQSYQKSDFF